MMKQTTVAKTLKRIEKSLDLIEMHGHGDLTLPAIADKIAWLRRYGHIDGETAGRLADRVCELIPLCEF